MSTVVFSAAARSDRRSITAHTIERFGLPQARRLRNLFERTLHLLAESPRLGHTNDELDPPDRAFRYFVVMRRFVVVYEPHRPGHSRRADPHSSRDSAREIERDEGAASRLAEFAGMSREHWYREDPARPVGAEGGERRDVVGQESERGQVFVGEGAHRGKEVWLESIAVFSLVNYHYRCEARPTLPDLARLDSTPRYAFPGCSVAPDPEPSGRSPSAIDRRSARIPRQS